MRTVGVLPEINLQAMQYTIGALKPMSSRRIILYTEESRMDVRSKPRRPFGAPHWLVTDLSDIVPHSGPLKPADR